MGSVRNPLSRHKLLRLAALVVALGAAGCSPPTQTATQAEVPKKITLTYSVLSWPVHFPADSATLDAGEQQNLANFLATVRTGTDDRVTVEGVSPGSGGLAAARQTSIDAVLLSLRMQPSSAGGPAKAAAAAGNDVMMVKIGRYIVTGPNCPDWTKPESDDFSNTAPSNYGCATLTNLGMMVANPADLVRGATMGPADGDYAAGGVAAYHAGAIDKGVTFSSDSGGGS